MTRKLFLAAVLSFSLGSSCSAQRPAESDFELVESIPIETILDNPDIRDAHEVWLEMINGAKKSLDIEQFYISNEEGEPLEDIIQAVEKAAARGVTVRVTADARMSKTYPETIKRLGAQKNISTRIIDFGKLSGGILHAKYFIVDNETVFLGSQNFDWRALKHIHELGVRIRHKEAAQFYTDIFDLDWNLAATNDKSSISNYLTTKTYHSPYHLIHGTDTLTFTPTASPVGLLPDSTSWDEPNIVRLIDGAKAELCLQFLAYGIKARDKGEYRVLDDAIRRAADRGVKVRLIIADWEKGSSGEKALKELSQVPNIEVKFSVIPEWSGGYISFARVEHCKYIVADGSSFWLGTSNAEKSYFYTVRNVGVVVKSRRLGELLQRVFIKSWESPYTEPVDADREYKKKFHGEQKDTKEND